MDEKQLDVTDELSHNSDLIKERNEEIKDLLNDMSELNEIFRELNSLVVAEESRLSSVVKNVNQGKMETDEAARKIQAVYKKRRCVIL